MYVIFVTVLLGLSDNCIYKMSTHRQQGTRENDVLF